MTSDLIFMMGKYEARIPTDRWYAPNHLWLKSTGNEEGSPFRVGFTAYSVRMLQDVYFLEWSIDPQTQVAERQEIGEIESSKALSSLYTPYAGTLLEFNEDLLADPSAINADNYEAGWLFTLETSATCLSPEAYVERLKAGWEKDQRLIKGQIQ
jgi:glycine cleavage system H protein